MTLDERFWSKVNIGNSDECWEWQAGCRGMYGKFWCNNNRTTSSHILAYELAIGPIPTGMLVCHTCDNPLCCNPNHLFLGTHKDNSLDMVNKNRVAHNTGEHCGRSKLTERQVITIIQLCNKGYNQTQVAKMFGVHPSTVNLIINKKNWSYLS